MEDTTPEIKALVYKTVMARTEEERFLMCAEMFETAKRFAEERLPADLSEYERKKRVFEDIYGFEFPESSGKNIE